ncbi:MAG TPA: hypothetical protein VNN80_17460, partial [Polyangiaceae bacterium]|nr:hypothetical protein [Polyangiaceae bacterium]
MRRLEEELAFDRAVFCGAHQYFCVTFGFAQFFRERAQLLPWLFGRGLQHHQLAEAGERSEPIAEVTQLRSHDFAKHLPSPGLVVQELELGFRD